MAVRVQTDITNTLLPSGCILVERIRDRRFLHSMAQEMADWLQTRPSAPDQTESPAGWHKKFTSFTVCGEGEFVKTVFTIYSPGTPRRGSVDLDRWQPTLPPES